MTAPDGERAAFEAAYRRWRERLAWAATVAVVVACALVIWRFGS